MKLEELVNDWRTIDKRQNELLKEIDSELDFHDGGLATPSETARSMVKGSDEPLSIRRLSPREVMRLMGGPDIARDKQAQVTSNARAYKQHGNGIVAQVIGKIIGMMWYEDEEEMNEIVDRNSHTWLEKESK